jgi:hypothetical protein
MWILLMLPVLGCRDALAPGQPVAQVPAVPSPSILDAAHGGRPHFYFLPPLVPQPTYSGIFDPARSPTVRICRVNGLLCGTTIAEYTLASGPDSVTVQIDSVAEAYTVDWHTDQFGLVDGATYRIQVLVEGRQAGHVDVIRDGLEIKSATAGVEVPLEDERTLMIRFRIEIGFELVDLVPAQAPDTLPQGLYDPAHILPLSPCIAGQTLKDIVISVFRPGTPHPQRQEVIDRVGGEVIGGRRLAHYEGYYFVQLSADSTGERVCEAAELLRSLPFVLDAGHEVFADPLYRRPNDEGAWLREAWQVDPSDVAQSERWGLEAIAAPLAWGCEVGNLTTAVAVVDEGFHNVADIIENIAPRWRSHIGLYTATDHGTKVASIAGARGDNSSGITGLMWKADLRPYDSRVDSAGLGVYGARPLSMITKRVAEAIADGAAVVNLSQGINWEIRIGRKPGTVPDSLESDIQLTERFHHALKAVLDQVSRDSLPLLILGAGNDGVGAHWAGFPKIATDYPNHVIVTGYSTLGGSLAPLSNTGLLVDVAAPGYGVYALDGAGTPTSVYGTSFAAPYVTGLAGLLLSFDPSLPTDSVKSYIRKGAVRGKRTAGDYPIINAYESLKLAAERPGAPLCSNAVWASGGNLHVQRTETFAEVLAPIGATEAWQLEVLHGGKHIWYSTRSGGRVLGWNAGSRTWAAASLPADWQDRRGGTDGSLMGYSHDGDTLAYVDPSVVSGTTWYRTKSSEYAPVRGEVVATGSGYAIGQIQVDNLPGAVQTTCLERDPSNGHCYFSVIEDRIWLFRLGYPQLGKHAYVTVSPMHHVEVDSTAWAPCSFNASHECRAVQSLQRHVTSLVRTVDLTNGNTGLVDTIPDESVFWIGQAESGDRAVLGRGRWRITHWAAAAPYYQTGSPFYGWEQALETCTIEYRRLSDFGRLHAPITATREACHWSYLNYPSYPGGGTIAPNRVPSKPLRLSPESGVAGTPVTVLRPFVEITPSGLKTLK